MKASMTKQGLTVRVIAGTRNAIIAMDLQDNKRPGCLGFSIGRTDMGPASSAPSAGEFRWLPNMLRFPSEPGDEGTTITAPLQKFRWGDYTLKPAHRYRFTVVPRYGAPGQLTPVLSKTEPPHGHGITLDVITEDPTHEETFVHFNRAAAASNAFNLKFSDVDDLSANTPKAKQARDWLSNGLKEALLGYMKKAADNTWAIHGAIYEFQQAELLQGLQEAIGRGVDVKIVYHHRHKDAKDTTAKKNDDAVKRAELGTVAKPRKADPQSSIMHDKFLVLLKKENGKLVPKSVWTGSTNWTDGALYGQLNVGHAVFDEKVAAIYESCFKLLHDDADSSTMKQSLATLTPVSLTVPAGHHVIPILSPQSDDTMLHLYASLCEGAKSLLVSAPFALSPIILKVLSKKNEQAARFMLLDKIGSLGGPEEVNVIEGDPSNSIAVATTLSSPLHDFQKNLLEGKESFHHAGIHIHSKIFAIDPFGSDPIIVTGSANFSNNSTVVNDSNTLIIRGSTAIADIYACEFMRMFEHYHFRAKQAGKIKAGKPMALSETDAWSAKFYVKDSKEERDRRLFAGTLT
jgi:phosphatidylserine/phosphatidylglycerophosphate/cardiolipin synthase-like enzyme